MAKSNYQAELIFNLNSRLFKNTFAGMSEEDAQKRISDHSNSFSWIAAHTVWARYMIVAFLGNPQPNPYDDLFKGFKPYDDAQKYPSLEEISAQWNTASGFLQDALKTVSEEALAGESPIKSPIVENTNLGTVTFLAQHESYDIGQLGLLKKYFTNEAMSYS